MNISTPFINRPIAGTLVMAGLFLIGAVAYPFLPIAPLPQVDLPTLQISATLPGASPETMASSVAAVLERNFAQISGITQMTSSSALGTTSIVVQFDLDRNIDAAAQDIQSKINASAGQLPKDLPTPPTYRKVNPSDAAVLVLGVESDTLPVIQLDDFADTLLAQQLSEVPGVSQVQIFGEQKPAIRVQVDPARLASLGLSLEDVRAALAAVTVNQSKGSIEGTTQNFTLYANDQLRYAVQYDDVILAYRHGAPIRVRDVGRAVDGPENLRNVEWIDGRRTIAINITRQPGANVVDVVTRLKAALPRLQASLPPSMKLSIIDDRTRTIRAAIADVQMTLAIAIGLVVAVIFMFLQNFSATMIPSVTVPLSLAGTFAAMYALGYSLDNLSLMALTISVGFVVDDAIVMIENIIRHVEQGMSPREAAIKGAGEIGFTIVSISVSLIAVFIPVLMMGGVVGRLFHEFAMTVSLTIVISALVSLALTPMMCARLLKGGIQPMNRHGFRRLERFFDASRDAYGTSLRWVLRHQPMMLAIFFATMGLSVALYIVIPKGFFPQQDTSSLAGIADAAQDISYAAMSEKLERIFEIVRQDPAVHNVRGQLLGGQDNTGRVFIDLKPKSERDASADEVIRRLRRATASIEGVTLFLQSIQDINVGGRSARTQYQFTLTDADLDELNHWAPILKDRLASLPALADVATDQQSSAPTLDLTVDRATAARFGITPQLIDDTLDDAFSQRQVNQYFTQLNQYHVVLEVLPALQTDPTALRKIFVKSPLTGGLVPLSTFVRFDSSHSKPLSINHQGEFPAVTLSFNLAPGFALSEAVAVVEKALTDLHVPPTLTGTLQGNAQAFQASLASQPYLILAAIVVMYIVLGILYESFVHPLTILSTLPSAGVGALLILLLVHDDLSVIGLIGILLLIGIVKKNAIMMIDFALQAERRQGLPPPEAIYQACLARFRPIMMTTAATLLGAVPLMLGTGTGSEIRQPLGFSIVGGLLVSQVLTLYTTPVVYLYLDRLQHTLRRRRLPWAPHRLSAVQRAFQAE